MLALFFCNNEMQKKNQKPEKIVKIQEENLDIF